ncbi:antichymotrypsin-2-like isoform X8 [Leptopilina heterotoma]|uniref:antichymotrypsin-2-like isoform X8 n=1 Tax=Leptopilina heterotoma TaxID=63436 RepID=UPI001CA88D8B|nr:antichymotrypsin-2-like isoform X8 [Leptopilina heterotoma]
MRLFIFLCALTAYTMAAAVDKQVSPLQAVTNSAEQFSTHFYKTVAKKQPGNLITSPLSANVVLSMAAFGAKENTKKQMQEVLRMPADEGLSKTGYQNLIDSLNSVKEVDLKLANKIFPSVNLEVKPEFKALTKDNFRSEEQQVDFSKSSEAAKTINTWCEEKTNKKIKDLIKPDDVDASTAMVLVNAVYFKGQWKLKFDANNTHNKPFHVDEKTVKDVPTMYKNGKLVYGELPEMKAKFVEIPYKGDEVSMLIILPDEINGLQEVEQKMSEMSLDDIRRRGSQVEVELYLPKFKIESTIDLKDTLTEMGMGEMFTDQANFRNIADADLKVSKVVQKAFIEVNEEGSEAAAATAVIIAFVDSVGELQPPPVIFTIDKPFSYYLIYNKHNTNSLSTTVLFSGHIKEPIN